MTIQFHQLQSIRFLSWVICQHSINWWLQQIQFSNTGPRLIWIMKSRSNWLFFHHSVSNCDLIWCCTWHESLKVLGNLAEKLEVCLSPAALHLTAPDSNITPCYISNWSAVNKCCLSAFLMNDSHKGKAQMCCDYNKSQLLFHRLNTFN